MVLFSPIEIGLFGRPAPGVGLRRRDNSNNRLVKKSVSIRCTRVNPCPICTCSARLKSAFWGVLRRASACADATTRVTALKNVSIRCVRVNPCPICTCSARLKSAFLGALRRASACADAIIRITAL